VLRPQLIEKHGSVAFGTLPQHDVLAVHDARDEEHRVLEVQFRIGLPLAISLQGLAEEFAVFDGWQTLGRVGPAACAEHADDSTNAGEQGRLAPVALGSKEDVQGARGGSASTFIRIESPPPPQAHELISRQAAPVTRCLRTCTVCEQSES
jgi:hypothetical protein